MRWYLAVLKSCVGFSGHARRKEYQMSILINAIIGVIVNVIQLILDLEFSFLSLVYLAVTIIPIIVLRVRRLHNADRSGVWALPYLIPIIGWLFLFVFACLEGNSGSNRYGNDPKFGSN